MSPSHLRTQLSPALYPFSLSADSVPVPDICFRPLKRQRQSRAGEVRGYSLHTLRYAMLHPPTAPITEAWVSTLQCRTVYHVKLGQELNFHLQFSQTKLGQSLGGVAGWEIGQRTWPCRVWHACFQATVFTEEKGSVKYLSRCPYQKFVTFNSGWKWS